MRRQPQARKQKQEEREAKAVKPTDNRKFKELLRSDVPVPAKVVEPRAIVPKQITKNVPSPERLEDAKR